MIGSDGGVTFATGSNVRASVIIPAYNAEKFLATAVSSALCQTMGELEVLIVDDRSEDGTLSLAQHLAKQDSRIRVLANEIRMGPAGARNKAIEQAQGRWIALLDADDSFAPDRLQILIGIAEQHGYEFAADNLVVRAADGSPDSLGFSPALMKQQSPFGLTQFVVYDTFPEEKHLAIGYCKPIFSLEFVRQHELSYDLRALRGQDFIFYFQAIARGARFVLVDCALYHFRVGHASHSTGLKALRQIADANTRLLREDKGVDRETRRALRVRDAKMRFELFRAHTRNRAFVNAALALIRVDPRFALRKFLAAAVRRVKLADDRISPP